MVATGHWTNHSYQSRRITDHKQAAEVQNGNKSLGLIAFKLVA